jgi:beta-D-xylosidase 4
LIWGGYPGQDGGTALFDIITGKQGPAGRLPITQYPADYVDQVPITDMSLRPGTGNPGRTYKWYNQTPVVEFGTGLHYTNFTFDWASGTNVTSFDIQHRKRHFGLCRFVVLEVDCWPCPLSEQVTRVV